MIEKSRTPEHKRLKILITGVHEMNCNGETGQFISLFTHLKKRYPEAIFRIGELNGDIGQQQLKRALGEDIQSVKFYKALTSPKIRWTVRVVSLFLRQTLLYPGCDIVIHLCTDGYSDRVLPSKFLSTLGVIGHSYQMLCGKLCGKPVVACSTTIGPFDYAFTRRIAGFTLNRITGITAREDDTIEYLRELRVKSTIIKVADLAFLVEAAPPETVEAALQKAGVKAQKPLFGLAPSQIVSKRNRGSQTADWKYDAYVTAMAGIVDRMADRGCEVVLLCQTTSQKYDDSVVAARIKERAYYKPAIFDNRSYSPQIIKGIMQRCEMLFSSKLHSAIFGISEGTPTVTVAYAPKVYSIVGEMLHLPEYLVEIRSQDFSSFVKEANEKINRCWQERDGIREALRRTNPAVKELAMQNIEYIAGIIDRRSK